MKEEEEIDWDNHVRNMELGIIYVNKLLPDEKVIIDDMISKEMWGQTGKEHVTVVKYTYVSGIKGDANYTSTTTLDNFLMKYEDIQTIRDNKINQILDDE